MILAPSVKLLKIKPMFVQCKRRESSWPKDLLHDMVLC